MIVTSVVEIVLVFWFELKGWEPLIATRMCMCFLNVFLWLSVGFASFLLRCIFFNDHCEQLNSISRMNAF